jgi:hypothetical protein
MKNLTYLETCEFFENFKNKSFDYQFGIFDLSIYQIVKTTKDIKNKIYNFKKLKFKLIDNVLNFYLTNYKWLIQNIEKSIYSDGENVNIEISNGFKYCQKIDNEVLIATHGTHILINW